MNVLIYSGNGTTVESVKQSVNSLRKILSPYYSVTYVSATVLNDEPWQESTVLLVMPGGADLGYCKELDGIGTKKIYEYVRKGGRYLGFCAGGYWGAGRVEFEVGDPEMEVSGSRQLKFFPGTCKGCAFPGFQYGSHHGCKAVEVVVEAESLGQQIDNFRCYYNGGGVFIDADQYKSSGVEVLARYNEKTQVEDRTGSAAVVYRKIGNGHTILTGIHPEFEIHNKDAHNVKDNDQIAADIVQQLTGSDQLRLQFLAALLRKLGLKVNDTDAVIPRITPLYLTALRPEDLTNYLERLSTKIGFEGPSKNLLIGSQETFQFSSVNDQNEGNETEQNVDSLDQDPVTEQKQVKVFQTQYPSHKETPYFDHQLYYTTLRQQISDNYIKGVLGTILMYGEVVSSTSTMLDKNYNILGEMPHGLICSGTVQVAGRGRGNNVWVNPPGVLAVSGVLRFPVSQGPNTVFVQYLVSLAIVEALRGYGPQYADAPIFLKWPNDVYAEEPDYDPDSSKKKYTKIAGVLVTSNILDGEYVLVYGAGINLYNAAPTTSANMVLDKYNKDRASEGSAKLAPYKSEVLLAHIQTKLESMLASFNAQGFAPFERRYYQLWLHNNQKVTLEQYDNTKAIVRGITLDYGLLEVEEVDRHDKPLGNVYQLQPDGNSFDIFKGLLKRKTT